MPAPIELQVEIIAEFLVTMGFFLHQPLVRSQSSIRGASYQGQTFDPEYHFLWGMHHLALAHKARNTKRKMKEAEMAEQMFETGLQQSRKNTEGWISFRAWKAMATLEIACASYNGDETLFTEKVKRVFDQLGGYWTQVEALKVGGDGPARDGPASEDKKRYIKARLRRLMAYVRHIQASLLPAGHGDYYAEAKDQYDEARREAESVQRRVPARAWKYFLYHSWMADNKMPLRYRDRQHRFVCRIMRLQGLRAWWWNLITY